MRKKIDPDDVPGALVIWSFAIVVATICVCVAILVVRWTFGL